MIVVRFRVTCQPGKSEEVAAALKSVIPPSQAMAGVVSFDIGRDLDDPDVFIATEVFEHREALERQESLPEVTAALSVLENSLAGPPEATLFEVASSEPWGG